MEKHIEKRKVGEVMTRSPVTVGPKTSLPELKALFHKYGYDPCVYGHFGDGLVHCTVAFDLYDEPGIRAWRRFLGEAADLVVRYDGSLSGEHGDGQARAELLQKMYGPELVDVFRQFKTIWDPLAVTFARAAGPGGRLRMRIGGKAGVLSGDPLDLDVTVAAVTDDLYQRYAGVGNSLGPAARVTAGGIDIILASRRNQVRSPDVFRGLGLDPLGAKLLVVKSTNHFRAEFEKIAAEILYVAPPDVFSAVPFTRIPRPKWPLDPDAFADLEAAGLVPAGGPRTDRAPD